VPVEPDLVGEDRVDAVVAGEQVVEPRQLEQLALPLEKLRLRRLTRAAVEAQRPVPSRHRPVGVRGQDDLRSQQREDPPALEEKSLSWQIAVPTRAKPRSYTAQSEA